MWQFMLRVWRRIRTHGVWSTLRWSAFRSSEELRDWRLGIQTTGYISRDDLGLPKSSLSYEPARYSWIDAVLHWFEVTSGVDVALDYGAGMGRFVAAAARRPFKRVIGVEISPELSAIARANMGGLRRRRCAVEIVTADAAKYRVPSDVSMVFIYNPFGPLIMARVRENLLASLAERPRQLTIFYLYGVGTGDRLAEWDWLNRLAEIPTGEEELVRMIVYGCDPGRVPTTAGERGRV